jgi:uroporphyrin-III C-methyltransferase/precorrin-2 dehydrogenase/sirohydrochlorin ferrochelatase
LPLFVVLTERPVILLGDGPATAAKRRLLERAGARIVAEDGAAALAIVAIEDEAEAQAAVGRLKARGILVNAVDRPALCDFTLPAIIDRDPMLIAIGTGGASAGLAKALRQRLEALLPAGIGSLATRLRDQRDAIRAHWPTPEARRRAIDDSLSPGGPLDPLSEQDADAFAAWLAADAEMATARTEVIALRSTDPEDLTLREARLLGQADRIFHLPDVPAAILDRARADAERLPVSAFPGAVEAGLTLHIGWSAA